MCPRKIGFLSAAVSMKRRAVGAMGRAMKAIPVVRPQDLAVPGAGTIYGSAFCLLGTGTAFLSAAAPGGAVVFSLGPDKVHLVIGSIVSDTEIALKDAMPRALDVDAAVKFKLVPKVDQSSLFGGCWDLLHRGRCLGIFPEGGSHDRTDLLDIKAGVALMVLGAMAKYPGLRVNVIPVGLNYFSGHKFRSRCYIDFGEVYVPPPELVAKFAAGGTMKREAIAELLKALELQLRAVTVTAPDHATLQVFFEMRRLYKPTGALLSTHDTLRLTRWLLHILQDPAAMVQMKPLMTRVRAHSLHGAAQARLNT